MGRTKTAPSSVTHERATRLAKFLKLIAKVPRPREVLANKLGLDTRGFYRDVKTLRGLGIAVRSDGDQYHLDGDLDEARGLLPCPDPQLTIAELRTLSRGTTEAHRKVKKLLDALIGSAATSNGYHKLG
jgi:predicted DNA-binding transcriptional regulator YafY